MLLDFCQRVLDRCVSESSAAREQLAALEGTSFGVEVEGLGIALVMRAAAGRLEVASEGVEAADAWVRSTPLDLLRLARDGSLRELAGTGATVGGRIQVAESYAELLRLARPDLEDELAGWIGDLAAHEIGTASRALAAWSGRARHALEQDVAEYLQEESPMLARPDEVKRFSAEVDSLRDAVERFGERIALLDRARAGS